VFYSTDFKTHLINSVFEGVRRIDSPVTEQQLIELEKSWSCVKIGKVIISNVQKIEYVQERLIHLMDKFRETDNLKILKLEIQRRINELDCIIIIL
jgi:hypothetical protein